jgi:hypothetical protein
MKSIKCFFYSGISLSPFICLTEGNILVEDIVKLASQTEENNEAEETAR